MFDWNMKAPCMLKTCMLKTSLLSLLCVGFIATGVSAEEKEFRCDSEVFVGAEKKPVQSSLTIFANPMVYDFLQGTTEEVTVYDFGRGQITLLNPQRKQRVTVATDDLLRVSAAYKTMKAETDLFAFCMQPAFDEEFANDTLTLTSKYLTYHTSCSKPKQPGADKVYREFADWSSRLNAFRPGNLPPFARLEMNKSLAARDRLPIKIDRTTTLTHGVRTRQETIRSEHIFSWTLSVEDRRRIERAGSYMADFAPVSVESYFDLETAVK